jgi:hypothetical protein
VPSVVNFAANRARDAKEKDKKIYTTAPGGKIKKDMTADTSDIEEHTNDSVLVTHVASGIGATRQLKLALQIGRQRNTGAGRSAGAGQEE